MLEVILAAIHKTQLQPYDSVVAALSNDGNPNTTRIVAETVYDGHFDVPKTKRGRRTIPIGTEATIVLSELRPKTPSGQLAYLVKAIGSHWSDGIFSEDI